MKAVDSEARGNRTLLLINTLLTFLYTTNQVEEKTLKPPSSKSDFSK